MSSFLAGLDFLVAHGLSLLCGITCVLAVGCVAMSLCRSPIERRRLGLLVGLGNPGQDLRLSRRSAGTQVAKPVY